MVDWMLPSLAYVVSLGALGITSKFALRTMRWQVLIVCAALAYVLTSSVLLIAGAKITIEPAVGWALLAGALAVIGLSLFNIALERGSASLVVPITASYPLAGTLMAAVVLSEEITAVRVGGMLLIIAGAVILGREDAEEVAP